MFGRYKRLIGRLGWSDELDFFIDTDAGQRWKLDLPWLMSDYAYRHVWTRVYVDSIRTGWREVYVTNLLPAPPQGGWVERMIFWLEHRFGI